MNGPTHTIRRGDRFVPRRDCPYCRREFSEVPHVGRRRIGLATRQLRGFMSLNAAVIGGGISGLASAVRIAGLGARVTLYEGESFLGGLGTTFPYGDTHLERFYHCILPSDAALRR